MHELPVMEKVLAVVLKHAAMNGAQRVYGVHIQVGALSDLEETWMQRYFDTLSEGTVAEEAAIKIERTPAVVRCSACGRDFSPDLGAIDDFACPACGSAKGDLVSGRGYTIVSLEAA
jgi:hydrogenase nickel incorporation protein HypA/HybF